MKRLGLEHDVFHDVVGQAVDVQVGQATFVELSLGIKINDKLDRYNVYEGQNTLA